MTIRILAHFACEYGVVPATLTLVLIRASLMGEFTAPLLTVVSDAQSGVDCEALWCLVRAFSDSIFTFGLTFSPAV